MTVIPNEDNDPLWIRLALTRDQISSLPEGPINISGSAEVQYVSKHDVGGKSNVEMRIKELSLRGNNV